MKTTTKNTTTPAPVPSSTTPTMDTVLSIAVAAHGPEERWRLEGWAAHMRTMRHQNHAVNSWKKHASEFEDCFDAARMLTVARMVDFGMTAADAGDLLFKDRATTRH